MIWFGFDIIVFYAAWRSWYGIGHVRAIDLEMMWKPFARGIFGGSVIVMDARQLLASSFTR